jgi:RimJ/RimL family protein N-acetyltransferase
VPSRSPLPDTTEIGWRLTRASWGQGIASETAGAMLQHARDELRVGPVVALIHPDTAASVRVARKIGLRPAGETIVRGGRQLVYRPG